MQDVFSLNPAPSAVKAGHESNLSKNINKISCMWHSYQEKAAAFKTARGKQNRSKSYFEIVSFYTDRFFPENLTLIEQIKKEAHEQYGLEELE